ncbi:MAG: CheB methylesterase domain-containing protein, partial [Terriglobales bacterium]
TGGPPAIKALITNLDEEVRAPILVVQHIAAGFLPGFIDWLGKCTQRRIKVAEQGESLHESTIYVAPDGVHLGVSASGAAVALSDGPAEHGTKPAISAMFRTLVKAYRDECVAVLLTGMGTDGAAELKSLKDSGAITIAQDKDSSVVHGMPGEAIRLGGATFTLAPAQAAERLNQLAHEYWSGTTRPARK